jgi:hypothetical protein
MMCLSKSSITSVRRSSFLGRTASAVFKGRSDGKRTGPATAVDSSFPPPAGNPAQQLHPPHTPALHREAKELPPAILRSAPADVAHAPRCRRDPPAVR